MTCQLKTQELNAKSKSNEESEKDETKEDIFSDNAKTVPYSVEVATKALYKRIGRFIKLIDYMLIQLKIYIIKNSYSNVTLNDIIVIR